MKIPQNDCSTVSAQKHKLTTLRWNIVCKKVPCFTQTIHFSTYRCELYQRKQIKEGSDNWLTIICIHYIVNLAVQMGNSHIPFKDLVSVYILKIWRRLEEINVYDGKTLEFQKK